MQFNYSKRHLKRNLILGIIQIGIGILSLTLDSISWFFQYGWILIGIVTLSQNYRNRKDPYLILDNEILSTQNLFGYKTTRISEFSEVLKKNDYLILKNDKKRKKIWIWLAEERTSEILHSELLKIIDSKN